MFSSDNSTQELARARFRLRDDLVFTPRKHGRKQCVHIESAERFFKIGVPEYTFISLLDGNTSIAEALSITACNLGQDAFTEQEAVSICRWLVDSGLASNVEHEAPADFRKKQPPWYQRLNPFWIKLPLLNPDALLTRMQRVFGWIHSPVALFASLILGVVAVTTLASNWSKLDTSSDNIFAPANWIWLGATWILLKLVHEFSHGLACKRYGGDVRELGVVFILFAPLAYVDLTSAWRFKSKWQRIHTALAGIYIELVIASIATLVWAGTQSTETAHRCLNIMLLSSVTTILFNANALMRFDGYYALSDFVEIPNLYTDAQTKLRTVVRRIFMGDTTRATEPSTTADVLVFLYGLATFFWKILICVGLSISAATLFHGAGIFLAAAGIVLWMALPVFKLLQSLTRQFRFEPAKGVRCGLIFSCLIFTVGSVLWFAPWPGGRTVPALVEFAPPTHVRAGVDGFVQTLHVKDGQFVHTGDKLVEMTNYEIETACTELEIEIEQTIARRRLWTQKRELGQAQTETNNLLALQKQLAEKDALRNRLTLYATVSGRISARRLSDLHGTHITEGQEILVIGDESIKELRLSIPQDDIDAFRAVLQPPAGSQASLSERPPEISRSGNVSIRIAGLPTTSGRLDRLNPRASTEPPHEALCATNNGWIPVRPVEKNETGESGLEFLEPRFTGFVRLNENTASLLPTGRTAMVTLGHDDRRLATGLYEVASRWIRDTSVEIGLQ